MLARPPGSVERRPLAKAQVPVPLTRLVGRTREIEEGAALLALSRLLTLTGPGGTGKTRLAVELAGHSRALFSGGVVWIELASLTDPLSLDEHIAAATDVMDFGARGVLDAIIETLSTQPTLLVLDNCEHLVDACAGLADTLLRRCERLTIMATSREALGIEGERTWLVPPLALADAASVSAERVGQSEAAQLFVDRAQASLAGFVLTDTNAGAVARICRRLDGIPLAIELAAARIAVLTPEQIAERLDSSFALLTGGLRKTLARHRTLRETIEWSYRLLTEREQMLLARLAVFAGPFTLESVEMVCADERIERLAVIDVLTGLIDKSMVMRDAQGAEARYHLLATVRQFARGELDASGDTLRWQRRHANHFLKEAEAIAPRIFGGAADLALVARIEADLDEFHAAADWAVEDPDRAEIAVRLGTALNWFWFVWGRFVEGRRRLTVALDTAAALDAPVRGRALTALGTLAIWQGDFEAARDPLEQAVAALRHLDDGHALAWALTGVATTDLGQGRLAAALRGFEDASAVLGPLDKSVLSAVIDYWRGLAVQAGGDLAQARRSFGRAVAIGREISHAPGIAHASFALGRLDHFEGDDRAAREHLTESLRIFHPLHDQWGQFQVLGAFAELAARAGDGVRAIRLVAASEAIRKRIGVQLLHNTDQFSRLMAAIRSLVSPEIFERAWLDGATLDREQVFTLALEADQAAVVAGTRGTATTAAAGVARPQKDRAPRLRVLALGPLEIHRGSRRLDARAWASVKSRELLLLLLCHPDGCTKEQAALALWPDASASQVRNNFHVTVHRLRRTLGDGEWCIADGDRYKINPAYEREFDATEFERQAQAGARTSTREEALPRLAAALALYRGDFLEHEAIGDWHADRRETLQRLYVDSLAIYATHLAAAGHHAEAAAAYRRLIARDSLAEPAYRGLMTSLVEAGDRAEARRAFDTLVRVLRTELDAGPDSETLALVRRLFKPAAT